MASSGRLPEVPVKQSFAYGSPGSISIPQRIDRTVAQRSPLDVISADVSQAQLRSLPSRATAGRVQAAAPPRARMPVISEGLAERRVSQNLASGDLPAGRSASIHAFSTEEPLASSAGISSHSNSLSVASRSPQLPVIEEVSGEANRQDEESEDELAEVVQTPTRRFVSSESPRPLENLPQTLAPRTVYNYVAPQRPRSHAERKDGDGDWMTDLYKVLITKGVSSLKLLLVIMVGLGLLLGTYRYLSPPLPYLSWLDKPTVIYNTPTGSIVNDSKRVFGGLTHWQYQYLTGRINTMETSMNIIAKSVNTPNPQLRVNFFSPTSGVLVDPYLTSPSREIQPPIKALWGLSVTPAMIQPPSPAAVFHQWNEPGDCWCAPESGGRSQIGILLPRPVIPQDLVVEHIPAEATLDGAAIPKDIELWVQIEDYNTRAVVKMAARDNVVDDLDYGQSTTDQRSSMPSNPRDDYSTLHGLDESWVRVGRWRYEIQGKSNVQTFSLPVRLEDYNVPVKKLVFRTVNSWGESRHVCVYRLKLYGLVAETTERVPVLRYG